MVYGGIDGYSRLITILRCSSNNNYWSETMLSGYVQAVQEYGIPSRVQTGHGGEMSGSGSTWKSKGDKEEIFTLLGEVCITLALRDCGEMFTVQYLLPIAALFYDLERAGALNADNDAYLLALHYVFLPRTNSSLVRFTSAWNNHPLSTENNLTPLQIYTAYSQGSELFDEDIDPTNVYGQDLDATYTNNDGDEDSVVVPDTDILPSQSSLINLVSQLTHCRTVMILGSSCT